MGRDLREYAKNTQVRLVAGFLALLFLVGDGLIWLLYGKAAGLVGLGCILSALLPVGLVGLFLWLSEKIMQARR